MNDESMTNGATEEPKKKKRNSTSISKTMGRNIMATISELNVISEESMLYDYLSRISDGVPKDTLSRFYEQLNSKKTFEDKYMYVYNIALASEGFVTYGSNYKG